jgi:hypothetical protein
MERFQGKLLREKRTVLDGITGTFTAPLEGFFAAPAGTSLVAGVRCELALVDGRTLPVTLTKVVLNGHRPAMVFFGLAGS